MKILCVSDHKDPIVYSSQVKERFQGIDLILGAGDVPESTVYVDRTVDKAIACRSFRCKNM